MSNQTSIYNEKKIAYYDATYKLGALSKPQDVNITVTAEHLYGLAYIMEQNGTIEGDPVYTRFSCSLDEVTKVYINDNSRKSPLYIQCDTITKGALNRKRIIVPCIKDPAEAVNTINAAKRAFDAKNEKAKERSNAQKAAAVSQPEPVSAPAASYAEPQVSVSDRLRDAAKGAADKFKDTADKMKNFELSKKKADSFFDSIPIPKDLFKGKKGSDRNPAPIPAEVANANAAAEAALNAFNARNEADVPVAPVHIEATPKPAAPTAAAPVTETPAPTPVAAQPAAAKPAAEVLPEVKPLPKVTAEDLAKLNESIDLDFITATEPPINKVKKNADRYLDDIGADYKPAAKHDPATELGSDAGNIVIEDMSKLDPVSGEVLPDISDLESELGSGIVLSDMSGNAVDVKNEATPVERMDFVRKSKHTKPAPVAEEIKAEEPAAAEVLPNADAISDNAAEVEKELPEMAAEDAYIDDETTADTEAIAAAPAAETAAEVRNVHIDFSTEISQDTTLEEFQEAVRKLRSMLDSDLITKEEFMAEKKKLLAALY